MNSCAKRMLSGIMLATIATCDKPKQDCGTSSLIEEEESYPGIEWTSRMEIVWYVEEGKSVCYCKQQFDLHPDYNLLYMIIDAELNGQSGINDDFIVRSCTIFKAGSVPLPNASAGPAHHVLKRVEGSD